MLWISEVASQERTITGFVDFLATNGKYVWATNQDKLQKFDIDHRTAITEITVPKASGIPVYAFSAVWVASLENNSIYKIDSENDVIQAIISTGLADQSGEFSLAASADAIWLVSEEGLLIKIDPISHLITQRIVVLPYSYNLSFGAGALWLTNTRHASVQRIDPELHQVTAQISVDDTPWFLSATDQYVWTLNQTHGTVSQIDTQNNCMLRTITLPEQAKGIGGDIFASHTRVWVRTSLILLIEIDANSGQIIRTFQHTEAAGSGAIIQCNTQLWMTAHDINKLWIIDL